jgi:putative transposase
MHATAVKHISKWKESGYDEIQEPPVRYALVDRSSLMGLFPFSSMGALTNAHRSWAEKPLRGQRRARNNKKIEYVVWPDTT